MTMTDGALIKAVRTKTVDSPTTLPDSKILYFAGRLTGDDEYTFNLYDGVLDFYGVCADIWLDVLKRIEWYSQQLGAGAVSKPAAEQRYKEFLALSVRGGGDGTGSSGNVLGTSGLMTRDDLIGIPAGTTGTEFGG